MAFKLIEAAQDRWRAVNGPHLVALVRAGATFINSKLVDDPTTTTNQKPPKDLHPQVLTIAPPIEESGSAAVRRILRPGTTWVRRFGRRVDRRDASVAFRAAGVNPTGGLCPRLLGEGLGLFQPVYLTRRPSRTAAGTALYAAFDLETTGLNPRRSIAVGIWPRPGRRRRAAFEACGRGFS
jgi:hypothetical protein